MDEIARLNVENHTLACTNAALEQRTREMELEAKLA